MSADKIELRRATPGDVRALAGMNRQLIEDEGSHNPMSLRDLEARMMGWITEGWDILLILREGETAGYCLYREIPDEYFPDRIEIYIRQFFVKREHRGLGIGRSAFEKIMRERLPAGVRVSVDALETNPRGQRFWEKLGFEPAYTNLQRTVPDHGRARGSTEGHGP